MKYEYMKESEQMLQYFQFPKFLLKLRISQTAKFLYMVLYDRARISRKNSWIDKYGNVYLIFPIDEYSVQIDKCKSSVKTAMTIRRLKRWLQQRRNSNLHLVVKMAVQESEMWHLVK